MRALVITIALVGLAGCANEPIEQSQTNNPAIRISLLFEHDGCRVYRFADAGHSRYFVKCASGSGTVSWNEYCGKGCTRPMTISTSMENRQ